jgi:hypothetical protein
VISREESSHLHRCAAGDGPPKDFSPSSELSSWRLPATVCMSSVAAADMGVHVHGIRWNAEMRALFGGLRGCLPVGSIVRNALECAACLVAWLPLGGGIEPAAYRHLASGTDLITILRCFLSF